MAADAGTSIQGPIRVWLNVYGYDGSINFHSVDTLPLIDSIELLNNVGSNVLTRTYDITQYATAASQAQKRSFGIILKIEATSPPGVIVDSVTASSNVFISSRSKDVVYKFPTTKFPPAAFSVSMRLTSPTSPFPAAGVGPSYSENNVINMFGSSNDSETILPSDVAAGINNLSSNSSSFIVGSSLPDHARNRVIDLDATSQVARANALKT